MTKLCAYLLVVVALASCAQLAPRGDFDAAPAAVDADAALANGDAGADADAGTDADVGVLDAADVKGPDVADTVDAQDTLDAPDESVADAADVTDVPDAVPGLDAAPDADAQADVVAASCAGQPDWTPCGDGLVCDGAGGCVDVKTAKGMAFIPAGTFWMGCNAPKDSNCNTDEYPQHKVTLSAYYMDLTETTVTQYKACVDALVCTAPSTQSPSTYATYPGFPNNPVNYVSYTQSQAYCKWRGSAYDLPTEAQWEMAAKGSCEKNGSTAGDAGCAAAMRTYPWGEATATCSYAVMSNGTYGCGTGATWAVGSLPAGDSPYGLHDMAGNVWEWNRDWYSSTYYSSSPATDPYDSARSVPGIDSSRQGIDKHKDL